MWGSAEKWASLAPKPKTWGTVGIRVDIVQGILRGETS